MIKTNNHRISFATFGCRLNQSETAVLERSFEHQGYTIVDIKDPADIVVINTCTVTENGDADTRRLVNKVARMNPEAHIALIGCQAQIQKHKLADLPNVRWVIGNALKMELVSIIQSGYDHTTSRVMTPAIPRRSFSIPVAGIDHKHTRVNIKIQDGCDFFCSFCEIPYARGRARSRVFHNILSEAKILVQSGHKELVLTGINVGTYKHQNKTFMDVINALEQIPGLLRIRISSIEPTTIPLGLIKKMSGRTKLCRYLHIPLQSASDPILKAMKRKYTYEEFKNFINMVSPSIKNVCIGTDLIVGFPGENDDFFRQSYQRLKNSAVHYFHVFSYSQRQMAKSKNFPEAVTRPVIQIRSQKMRDLSQRKRELFYRSLIGTTQEVLVEQNKKGFWTGLTDNFIRVNFPSTENLQNRFVKVQLEKLCGSAVLGSMV